MSQEIIMPKLGLTMTHAKITRWLKKEGERVSAGEVLLEIETDKINSDVESPVDGYVLKILAGEGEDREITTPLCIVGEKDEAAPAKPAGGRIFITPAARMLAKQKGLDYTGIRGTGPEGRIVRKDILRVIEVKASLPEENSGDNTRLRITPVAKNIAKEHGIDYTSIKGTGPDGRIVKEDVMAAVSAVEPLKETKKAVLQADLQEEIGRRIIKKVPLEGIRKIIAARLTQSKHDIPHVYFKVTVDAGNLMELKNRATEKIKAMTGMKLSLNDLIVKAAACALEEFPDFNASLIEDEIIYYENSNIGIAVESERGLVVPVIKNANKKSLTEMCRGLGDLIGRARAGRLSLEDMAGGTFTVSNLGAYHIDEFSAIINPPESAILAVGRAAETPCAVNGQVVIRPVMKLTLSVDHRIIDGALAARFLKKLKDILEDPFLMLI